METSYVDKLGIRIIKDDKGEVRIYRRVDLFGDDHRLTRRDENITPSTLLDSYPVHVKLDK